MNEEIELCQAAMELLAKDEMQNMLLLERLRHHCAQDVAVCGGQVRLRDTCSGKYMFSSGSAQSMKALLESAQEENAIFFVADATQEEMLQKAGWYPHRYHQWVLRKPPVQTRPWEGYAFLPARSQDLSIICDSYQSREFDRAYLTRRVREGHTVCVYQDDQLVGYMLTHADGETGPMRLSPEHHGKDLGRQMVWRISQILQEDGYVPIGHIEPTNGASEHIHRTVGYEQCAQPVLWVYRDIEMGE